MADGTVRGAYELNAEQPIRQLRSIRDAGAAADVSLRTLGDTMDGFASPTRIERLNMVQSRISNIGSAARDSVGEVELLDTRLDELSRKRVTPKIDLSGVAETNAALSEIEARLDRLDHRRVSPNVSSTGGLGGLGGGGGGFPSQTPFGALGGFGGMALGALGLSPGIMGLLGGATSLVGSAGAGLLGAGAVGLGGAGELAVGAGVALVAKQAATGIQAITKAQTAYNTAVQTYGRNSAQAATDAKKLHDAMIQNAGAAVAARQVTLLQSDFRSATAPARAQIYQGVGNVAYSLRGALPSIAPDLTMAAGATAGAAGSYARFITGQQSLAGIGQLSQGFATDLPIAERSLQNITQTFGQLAVAAIPFFHEANVWVQHWTAGMATSTQDTARVQGVMQGLVTSAGDWARLTGSAYHLMRDIFSASAPSGDSMVVQLTHTLDRWDTWIRDNPQKVQTFFADARHTTSEVASGVSHLAGDFAKISQLLGPLFGRALQVLNLFTGLGPGGMSAVGAVLLGGYQGLRGSLGGRLPSAGGLLGSYVTGSAGPAMRSAGGGAGGAGAVAVGAGAAATLERVRALGAIPPQVSPLADWANLPPGEQNFLAAHGTVPGARFGGPTLVGQAQDLGLQARTFDTTATFSRLGGALSSAAGGAARFLGPVAAISAVLGAMQPTQGGGISARLQNTLSGLSFGILPGYTSPGAAQLASSQTFLQGLSGLAPSRQAQLIGQHVNQLYGPGEATSGTGMVSPQNLQALMTAQAAALGQAATTPAGLRALPGQLHAIQVAVSPALAPGARAQFQAQLGSILNQAAQGVGGTAASQWIDALTQGIGSAQNEQQVNKAISRAMSGVGSEISKLGPRGSRVFAGNMAQWVAQEERDYPKLRRPLSRFMDQIVTDINRMTGHIGTSMQDLQGKIFYINGQILTGTNAIWNGDNGIWASLTNKSNTTLEHLTGVFGLVQQQAINALSGMGFTKAQATQIVHQAVGGGAGAAAAKAAVLTVGVKPLPGQQGLPSPLSPTAPARLHQRGGQIPGEGMLDTVMVGPGAAAAPGEWIVNGPSMDKLDLAARNVYGITARQLVTGETQQHARWAMRGSPTRPGTAYAYGGYIDPISGFSVGRVDMGVDATSSPGTPIRAFGPSRMVGEQANWYAGQPEMVFQLTGGPDRGRYWYVAEQILPEVRQGQFIPQGGVVARYAPRGTGIEIGWAANASGTTLAQATTGYHEGQVTPAGSSFRSLIAGANPGMVGTASAPAPQIHLRAPRSGLGGYVGPMVDAASSIYTAGLQQRINQHLGASSAGAGNVAGGGLSGSLVAMVNQLARREGWSGSDVSAWLNVINAESGGNPQIVNPSSGAAGIAQFIGGFGQYAQYGGSAGSVSGQLTAMANYIRGRYGNPSAAWAHEMSQHWYQRGGPLRWGGWHAGGLDAVTSGPTLFGAGEGPKPERVRISPAAQPTASPTRSGHQITFHPGSIVVHGGGDPNKIAEAVAEKLIDALDGVDHGASDDQLLGAGG